MKELVSIQLTIRNSLINLLENHTISQLTNIPKGYSNNIFWNIAHVAATQQLLCYYLANVPMKIDKFWVDNFKKGTVPTIKIKRQHIAELIEILKNQPTEFLEDFNQNKFNNYQSYQTSMSVTLNSIEDASKYNFFHEGLHLGYVMAMKKLV